MDQREREYREAIGRGELLEFVDEDTVKKYPNLAKLLEPRMSSKGFRLDPVQFSIRMGVHCVLVVLRDPNWAQTLTATCTALDDCWSAVEALLALPLPPWVPTGKDPKLRPVKIPKS